MQVELKRVDNDFHFEATGTSKVVVNIDGAPDIGGHNAGARPMEMILMGLGGCSAIDIILILKKQKQVVEDFKIIIDGEREAGAVPSVFKKIHMNFIFKGDLNSDKVKRAIDLSVEKYCSVGAMLNKTAEITYSFEINK